MLQSRLVNRNPNSVLPSIETINSKMRETVHLQYITTTKCRRKTAWGMQITGKESENKSSRQTIRGKHKREEEIEDAYGQGGQTQERPEI
ncbi:hypothetical protein EUGRSUZ_E04337 [Eucalyptus grandis]|uniref:Uncharacterized protein n=2 Tax=Eucalyptus grandis TaxID=71139 RepID=A0ACC3L2D7_EUCGR|nr:hypothetical protein EUGRSUZ_E04337 [Eucalyptus grandis]